MRWICALVALSGPGTLLAQATLEAPERAIAGATIDVSWTGPGEDYDSVYILEPGQPESASGIHSSGILRKKNPIALTMPDMPGEFEIRYWSRLQKAVLARRTITLEDAPTTLDAAAEAPIGSALEVRWKSSGNTYDLIALYRAGSVDDAKALASATVLRKNPVVINLPEQPGEFELRYVTRQNKRVLARRAITVTAVDASLEAAESIKRGAVTEIAWQGPGNSYDRIEVHAAEAADDAKALAGASITGRKNPVTIKVPDEAGDYELRYVTAREGHILARRAFSISDVETALQAADQALAASPLQVSWRGPGNDYDRIELVDPSAPDSVLAKGVILRGRNPVLVNVPDVEGTHVLRYVTTMSNNVLAQRPIEIQPAGRLQVVFELSGGVSTGTKGGSGAIELIVDASGSMLKRTGSGERRIEIARNVLAKIVREYLADGQMFAMRVFGHRQADSCRTDLEVPLGPLDREATEQIVGGINAMNLAKTPIADSLALVANDLAKADGPKTVVLITDGEETCDGDPAAVVERLRGSGLDVQLSIVGFAIDDADLRDTFEQWARLGGGSYFDAGSADELLQSLRTVISGPYRVLDDSGAIVGEGIVGGADIVLPAGTYRVQMAGDARRTIETVVVKPRELTKASFSQ